MAKPKVLFVGFDSAEPTLLDKWSEDGKLPILQRMREQGVWGMAKTPPGFGNGVMWPSMFTGVNAGRHGRFFFRQLKPGDYRTSPFVEDTDFGFEPIWAQLSRAGKRCAVIDMVRAPLTPGINGVQVVDWITHDRTGVARSAPPELINRVMSEYGDDALGGASDAAHRKGPDYIKLCKDIVGRVETKTRMSLEYLAQEDWDLFMTVYADPHDIGHQCWHIHDESYNEHDPALRAEIGDPVYEVYEAIDRSIGELIEAAGPDTTVFVFSGPGMGPGYTANPWLDQILRRIEFGHQKTDTTYVDTLKNIYRKVVPPIVRTHIKSFAERADESMSEAERANRKYFSVPHNENSGAIRINLKGREREGKVEPGEEYDSVCDEVISNLMAIKNLETGEPLVERVVKIRDEFHGPLMDNLPDLLAIWHRPKPINKIGSEKIGEIDFDYPGTRTGDHTPIAIYFALGPNVQPGHRTDTTDVLDVAPTIAAALGVSVVGLDGAPIPEVVGHDQSNASVRSAG